MDHSSPVDKLFLVNTSTSQLRASSIRCYREFKFIAHTVYFLISSFECVKIQISFWPNWSREAKMFLTHCPRALSLFRAHIDAGLYIQCRMTLAIQSYGNVLSWLIWCCISHPFKNSWHCATGELRAERGRRVYYWCQRDESLVTRTCHNDELNEENNSTFSCWVLEWKQTGDNFSFLF